jgi:hypothetical protein
MDIFVALIFAGVPLAWILYKFAGAPLAWSIYNGRARKSPLPADPIIRLHGRGTYEFAIVGSSRYRSALEKIHGDGLPDHVGKEVEAVLVLEKTNHAVRVEVQGHTVGHLPTDLAGEYRRRLMEVGHLNVRGACRARITGRHGAVDYVDFAVRLDLPPKGLSGKQTL